MFIVQFHQDLIKLTSDSTEQDSSNFEVLNFFNKAKALIEINGLEKLIEFTAKKLTPTPKDLNNEAYTCQYFDLEALEWL